MQDTDDLWAAVRRTLPATEDLVEVVAAELREPVEEVRLSVLIGTIALGGQLGPEPAAAAAIEEQLARLQSAQDRPPRAGLLALSSLDDLLAEARDLQAKGSLDLAAIVAIQRASGTIVARNDRPMESLLHRYAVTRRLIWEHSVGAMHAGRLQPRLLAELGRFLLLWNELTSLAVTEGYRAAERELVANAVEARRGSLEELLGTVADDTVSDARLRRVAARHGLNPDGAYLLIAIAPIVDAESNLVQPGPGEDELHVLAGRIGHRLGATAAGADAPSAGIRLPTVVPIMRRIAVLAREGWAGLARVPDVLDSVLGSPVPKIGKAAWVAVGSRPINGVAALARSYADLVDATRTAQRLGVRGWIQDPEELALERLLLASPHLADDTVQRELGPVLANERFGQELIETLQAYFDAGENVTAAARLLHLATRTVGYRLERAEDHLVILSTGRAVVGSRRRSWCIGCGPPTESATRL